MRTFEEVWYRGAGALRLGGKCYQGEWGVWLELARARPGLEAVIPVEGSSKYEWAQKLAFRLSRQDLGKLGWALEQCQPGELLALVHRFRGVLKRLQVVRAANGAVFLNAQSEARSAAVALDGEGIWRLRRCLALAYQESLCQNGLRVDVGSAAPAT